MLYDRICSLILADPTGDRQPWNGKISGEHDDILHRAALNAIGEWDAHNVTEDTNLGIRIARHGYRTDMLPSVTYKETNIHPCLVLDPAKVALAQGL